MGPAGIGVLLEAVRCGDPSVSEPAYLKLNELRQEEPESDEDSEEQLPTQHIPAQPIVLTLPVHGVSSSSNEPASSNRPNRG